MLQNLDPIMAQKWHPNDSRRVRNSLKVYKDTGKRHSDLMLEQRAAKTVSGSVRYPTCIFWLHSNFEDLCARLDKRVDKMLQSDLLRELRDLRGKIGSDRENGREGNQVGGEASEGICQAIGYKEFLPYLRRVDDDGIDDHVSATLKNEAVEMMKQRTRRYARKQVTWIKNRVIPKVLQSSEDSVKVFLLDATDLENWNRDVRDTAINIAEDFLAGRPTPDPVTLNRTAAEFLTAQRSRTPLTAWKKRTCEICLRKGPDGVLTPYVANGPTEWEKHISGRAHNKRRRLEEQSAIPPAADETQSDNYSTPHEPQTKEAPSANDIKRESTA